MLMKTPAADDGVIFRAKVVVRRWRVKRKYWGVQPQAELVHTSEYARTMKLVDKFISAGFSVEADHEIFPDQGVKTWTGCPYDMLKIVVRR